MTAKKTEITAAKESALAPFKHRTFLVMWLAALISNIGIWMYSVGAGWLMTQLSPSPLVIALVQTATTLPILIFALPAGALADIFNRRTLLLITNTLMFCVAVLFSALVFQGAVNSTTLLLFTFLLGTGTAFMAPAWQAVIPRMVPEEKLSQAVALGGISVNLSRAIGPAFAGVLITFYGNSSPFFVTAASFVAIILALFWWQNKMPQSGDTLPPERVISAMQAGVRYARHSKPLKATMWHVLGFMFFANAYWALLPIIAKDTLSGNASLFGILMGAVGIGAVSGALFLPKLRAVLNANQLVATGTLGTSLIAAYFSIASSQIIAVFASLLFGLSWIMVLASVNVSAQQSLPDWVRARGLAVYMMVFYGSMSLGAAFWGWLADMTSIQTSMLAAAIGGATFILFSFRAELQQGKHLNLNPSNHWPTPQAQRGLDNSQGPVIIEIRYSVRPDDRDAFLNALYELKTARQRDGAHSWGVYEDIEQEGKFVEHYMEDSWIEHLRQHERVTHADRQLQEIVQAFHTGEEPPEVSHLLAAYPSTGKSP